MNLLLGGEGKTELGGFVHEPPYREPDRPGVVVALLRRVRIDGWGVHDAIPWRRIRKFKSGEHRSAEERNVLGLALHAAEKRCDAIAFVRDRDGSREREARVEAGIEKARKEFPEIRIAGGMAVEKVEAFVLGLLEDPKAETYRDPKAVLGNRRVDSVEQMVEIIEGADFERIPEAVTHLRCWMDRARDVLR